MPYGDRFVTPPVAVIDRGRNTRMRAVAVLALRIVVPAAFCAVVVPDQPKSAIASVLLMAATWPIGRTR